MKATLSLNDSCIHVQGEGVASLHTTHYAIGPYRIVLSDATSYGLAHLLAPSFAAFEEKEAVPGEPLLQLLVDHQLETCAHQPVLFEQEPESAEDSSRHEVKRLTFDWDEASCEVTFLAPGEHFITITPKQSATTYGLRSRDCFALAHLGIPEGIAPEEVHFVVNNYLMMLYAFAAAPHKVLLFHASAIVHQGKAYFFLGKSGTGKSTHSRLWLQHIPGCHLLNDDNPLVVVDKEGRRVTAYGSPWSGKTPCYRKESYPLGGVVRLEQAPANEYKSYLQGISAFSAVLPSCSMLRPEQTVAAGVMLSVLQLSQLVPVIHLRCLPDAEAALLSAKALGIDVAECKALAAL